MGSRIDNAFHSCLIKQFIFLEDTTIVNDVHTEIDARGNIYNYRLVQHPNSKGDLILQEGRHINSDITIDKDQKELCILHYGYSIAKSLVAEYAIPETGNENSNSEQMEVDLRNG